MLRIGLMMAIMLNNISASPASDLAFEYKGIKLGDTERQLAKKLRDASCYTNTLNKVRECVVRNTTYMNSDVDLIRFALPNGRLASITIEFYRMNISWDFGMSTEENMQRSTPVTFVCTLDSNVNTLEKKYGPHHKDFVQSNKPTQTNNTGSFIRNTYYWYGSGATLTYNRVHMLLDRDLSSYCDKKMTIEYDLFDEIMERGKHGKTAIEDM